MCVAFNGKDGIHRKRRKVPVAIVRNFMEYFMEYTYNKLTSLWGGSWNTGSSDGQVLARLDWIPCAKMLLFVGMLWRFARLGGWGAVRFSGPQ